MEANNNLNELEIVYVDEILFDFKNKQSPKFQKWDETYILNQKNLKETIGSNKISEKLFFDKYTLEKSTNIKIEFIDCVFDCPVTFNRNQKISSLKIENCKFNNKVIFKTEIDSISISYSTVFNDKVIFESIFNKSCKLNDTTFNKQFLFNSNSVFDKKLEFAKIIFNDTAVFRGLNFGKETSFIDCDLTNCSFINSNINDVYFDNSSFDFMNLIDEKNAVMKYIKNNQMNVNKIKDVISQYRYFEINFDKNKDYEKAGEFHIRRYELEYLITKKHPIKKILLFLYKWSSNFGENYVCSLGWFIFLLVFFSFVYLFSGLKYEGVEINWSIGYCYKALNDLGCSFLYSLNNSLPFRRELEFIKSANGWTTFFSIFETFIQTILATLFIVGLRRKFKR
jgi:uncharacterized protein YjbI with pentapeptide repeats